MSTVRKAVIPVAGMGTRFLPATKAIPKELLPLGDVPVIQHIVQEAVDSGIEEIIFITSEDKLAIEQHFEHNAGLEATLERKGKMELLDMVKDIHKMARFVYVHQHEPLGLGHAVLQAKDLIGDEPFMVFGGDDVMETDGTPVAKQMIEAYEEHGGPLFAVREVPQDQVSRYGVVDPSEELANGVFRLQGVVEKPPVEEAPSNLAVTGRWLLTPDVFEKLENTAPGAGDEIQLTDGILALFKDREVFAKKYVGTYRDCGNKMEYLKAVVSYALKHPDFAEGMRACISECEI